MLVKLEQSKKAYSPIEVTPAGIFMLVKLEQSKKAYSPIEVTPSGITLVLQPTVRMLVPFSIIQFPCE